MNARELAGAALRSVRRRPLRNSLATLGIALATAMLVALLTLSAAFQRALVDQIAERPLLPAIQVTAGSPRAGEPAKVLDGPAADALGRLPGVREAIPIVVVPVTLRAAGRSPAGTLFAMSPRRAPYGVVSGLPPVATDPSAIVLTDAGARALGFTAATAVGQNVSLELRRGDSGADRRSVALHVVGLTADEIPGLGIVALPLGEDALAWIATGESDAARDATTVATTVATGAAALFQKARGLWPWGARAQPAVDAAKQTLPKLTGTLAESFEGGAYTTQTFKAGTVVFRAENVGQGVGSFLGFVKPGTAAQAEELYNLAKYGNQAQVVTSYRLTSDVTVYIGKVAGGSAMQAFIPRGIDPASVLQRVAQEVLR